MPDLDVWDDPHDSRAEDAARKALLADLRNELRIARIGYANATRPTARQAWRISVTTLGDRIQALEDGGRLWEGYEGEGEAGKGE
jgi:hypothetical protein